MTLVLLFCSSSYGLEELEVGQCKDITIGETGRKFWVDSLGNGLRSELVDQIQKEEELFERLVPELEFDIGAKAKARLTFTRQVRDHLPTPKNNQITANDYFTLKVNNELFLDFSASVNGPYLFSEANTGLSLRHTTDEFPGKKASICDFYAVILDRNTERGVELLEGFEQGCTSRDKSQLTRAYDKTVDKLSSTLGWGLGHIVDTEKNKAVTKKLLDPLKVHTLVGVPIDYEIFFENNRDLNIGDVIEHTSFIGFTPGGVKLDMFSVFTPTHSYYGRVFRTLLLKKGLRNNVTIELEDNLVYGDRSEIYRIRPELLKLIKLNMGRWSIEDFKRESLLQRFEVDLNKEEGVNFLKKILSSLYMHDMGKDFLLKDPIIDTRAHGEAVFSEMPVFTDAAGKENSLRLKFPGILEFRKGSHTNIKNIKYKGREYTRGEKLQRSRFKFKSPLKFGFLKKWNADRDYFCKMQLSSDLSFALEDKSALNIECKYYDKYGNNEKFNNVKEYLDILLEGNTPQDVQDILSSVSYERPDVINFHSRISFSEVELERILQAKEDDIYAVISHLFFGAKSENIFSRSNHKKWKKANFRVGSIKSKKRLSRLRICSKLLYKLNITPTEEPLYDEFAGLVGKGRGLRNFRKRRCYDYFTLAKKIVKSISKLQVTTRDEKRLNKFLDVFKKLDHADFVQAVLIALGGGLRSDGVRYTYFLSSPYLSETITRTNGVSYGVEDPKVKKSLSAETRAQLDSRIKYVKLQYNSCQKDVIMAYIHLRYPVKDRSRIHAKFTLTDFSVLKDRALHESSMNFETQALKLPDDSGDFINRYAFRVQLEHPINEKLAHNMYVELVNENEFRLSRELKIYSKNIKPALDNI